jgi:response regulator NasT
MVKRMGSIIIVLPRLEDGKHIGEILSRHGMESIVVCTTGSRVLEEVHQLEEGIVISGYRLSDMHYTQLAEYLPRNFDLLILASRINLENVEPGILTLALPFRAADLVNTVEMMLGSQRKRLKKQRSAPPKRTQQEQNYINNAKWLLMERNHMSEEDAFRYLQKTSMDSGTNMVETAQMILLMMVE